MNKRLLLTRNEMFPMYKDVSFDEVDCYCFKPDARLFYESEIIVFVDNDRRCKVLKSIDF